MIKLPEEGKLFMSTSSPIEGSSSSSGLSSLSSSRAYSPASDNPLARSFEDLTSDLDKIRSQIPIEHTAYNAKGPQAKEARHAMQARLKDVENKFRQTIPLFLSQQSDLPPEKRKEVLHSIARLSSHIELLGNRIAKHPKPMFGEQKTKTAVKALSKMIPEMAEDVLNQAENSDYILSLLDEFSERIDNAIERLPADYEGYLESNPINEKDDFQFQLLDEIIRISDSSMSQIAKLLNKMPPQTLENPEFAQAIGNKLDYLIHQIKKATEQLSKYPDQKTRKTAEQAFLRMAQNFLKIQEKLTRSSPSFHNLSANLQKIVGIAINKEPSSIELSSSQMEELLNSLNHLYSSIHSAEASNHPKIESLRENAAHLYDLLDKFLSLKSVTVLSSEKRKLHLLLERVRDLKVENLCGLIACEERSLAEHEQKVADFTQQINLEIEGLEEYQQTAVRPTRMEKFQLETLKNELFEEKKALESTSSEQIDTHHLSEVVKKIEETEARLQQLSSFLIDATRYIEDKEREVEDLRDTLDSFIRRIPQEKKINFMIELGKTLPQSNSEDLKTFSQQQIIKAIQSGDILQLQSIMLALITQENPASDEIVKDALAQIWHKEISEGSSSAAILSFLEIIEKKFPPSITIDGKSLPFSEIAIQKLNLLSGKALVEITPHSRLSLSDMNREQMVERNTFNEKLKNLIESHIANQFEKLKQAMHAESVEVNRELEEVEYLNPLDELASLSPEVAKAKKQKITQAYIAFSENIKELLSTEKRFRLGIHFCENIMKSVKENSDLVSKQSIFEFASFVYENLTQHSTNMLESLTQAYQVFAEKGADMAPILIEGQRFSEEQFQKILAAKLMRLPEEDFEKIAGKLSKLQGKENDLSTQHALQALLDEIAVDHDIEKEPASGRDVRQMVENLTRCKVLPQYVNHFVSQPQIKETENLIKEYKDQRKEEVLQKGMAHFNSIISGLSSDYMEDSYVDELLSLASSTIWSEYFTLAGKTIKTKESEGKSGSIIERNIDYFEKKEKYKLNSSAIKEELGLNPNEKTDVDQLTLGAIMISPAQRLPRIALILGNVIKDGASVISPEYAKKMAPLQKFVSQFNQINNSATGIISSYAKQMVF